MDLPFTQHNISEKEFVRTFSENVEEEELQWHFDEQDRMVEVLESTDWLFQMDNELPKPFEGKIFIPAGKYHRVIKGTKDFNVKITLV